MIVCTNGQKAISTYQDTEWNDNGQYSDNPGVTNAFKCNPTLVAGCLGNLPDFNSWSHEKIKSIATAEVPFSVEYS